MTKQSAPPLLSSLMLLFCYLTFLVPQCQGFCCDNFQRYQRQRTVVTFPDTRQSFFALWDTKKDATKGVYVRPSAAIERGSGFFIPGLEGPKVRLLFGIVVLLLTAVNRALTIILPTDGVMTVTETLAIGYAMLLLLQAAIEFGKEERGFVVSLINPSDDDNDRADVWTQQWQNNREEKRIDQIQWSAASYLALTPATNMILIQNNTVLYQLGTLSNNDNDNKHGNVNEAAEACLAALQTLGRAKSGRISIPSTHPAAIALVNEADRRCVVLQIINETECWMMTSNQLLAAFTQQDLKWLGQLAKYVTLTSQ